MSIFGSNARVSKAVLDATAKILRGEQVEELDEMSSKEKMKKGLYNSKMDPVGQEDGDIDNDGDKDKSDKYLMNRRKAIKKAMKTDESVEIDEAQLKDLSPKDYKAMADKHYDQAKYHKKEAERHVNRDVKLRHQAAAKHHKDAGDLADDASNAISSDHPNKGDAVSDYKDKARIANDKSKYARADGAEADKRRAHVRKVDGKDVYEANDVDAGNVDKALKHDCATHVQHEEHGVGRCIPGMHTLVQVDEETGIVTHYDVMFENDEGSYIVENIPVQEMKVLKAMNHGHKRKKSMGEGYAGNYGSSVASYGREKDHEKRYEKENPGKKWKDLPWGHQQSHSAQYDKNPN